MRTVQSTAPRVLFRDRLSPRLALVFAATFAAVFLFIVFYTLFTGIGESARAEAEVSIQPTAIVIDPKIQKDLAKALAFDDIPTGTDVQNPFIDRGGIGTNTPAIFSSGSTAARAATTTVVPAAGSSGTGAVSGGTGSRPTVTHIVPAVPSQVLDTTGTRTRHQIWIQQQQSGQSLMAESETLSIDDLVPVGFVSGGNIGDEVTLYSATLCKTFTFPAGTRFYDGWLAGLNRQEVVFSNGSAIRRKSFVRPDQCAFQTEAQGSLTDDPRATRPRGY